jgi:hypothetical protein
LTTRRSTLNAKERLFLRRALPCDPLLLLAEPRFKALAVEAQRASDLERRHRWVRLDEAVDALHANLEHGTDLLRRQVDRLGRVG